MYHFQTWAWRWTEQAKILKLKLLRWSLLWRSICSFFPQGLGEREKWGKEMFLPWYSWLMKWRKYLEVPNASSLFNLELADFFPMGRTGGLICNTMDPLLESFTFVLRDRWKLNAQGKQSLLLEWTRYSVTLCSCTTCKGFNSAHSLMTPNVLLF